MRAHVISFAAASVLFMAAANAVPVNGAGYAAEFPCQPISGNQTMKAANLSIPLVSHSCEKDGVLYYLVVSTYPKGFMAKRPAEDAFYDAVMGAATNVRGVVRSDNPIMLGKVAGHDALIDVKKEKSTAHLRIFFVGDRQFQVLVAGPAGQENGKPTMAFLNSFKLK